MEFACNNYGDRASVCARGGGRGERVGSRSITR